MINYIVRRIGYGVLILIGVNLFTFMLFFAVNSPDDMARMNIGGKRVTQDAIEKWKVERGYDKPLLWNAEKPGIAKVTDTIFYDRSVQLFAFRFGASDSGRDIGHEMRQRVGPSIALAIPMFLLGIFVVIAFSLLLVFFRTTYLDFWGVTLRGVPAVDLGPVLHHRGPVLLRQDAEARADFGLLRGWDLFMFLALPIVVGIVSQLGRRSAVLPHDVAGGGRQGLRAHRALQGTVRDRGAVPPRAAQRAAADPDRTVAVLPLLFLGSLIMESFFGIPGLGSYTIDAINAQDFAIVRTMVFVGSALYIVGLSSPTSPTPSPIRASGLS